MVHAPQPSERDPAQRYVVSRNTVREVIQRLAARGLVRIKPGPGIFVSDQLRTGVTWYMDSFQRDKGLIDSDDMRDEPAVVYPASNVDSDVIRADMESAASLRQSMEAAGIQLPSILSASNNVGVPLGAMMGDQSLRRGGNVKRREMVLGSGGQRVPWTIELLAHTRNVPSVDVSITQGRIKDSFKFIGQSARRLAVVGAGLHTKRPCSQTVNLATSLNSDACRSEYRTGTVRQQHAQIPIAFLVDAPQISGTAGRMFLRRQVKPTSEVPGTVEVSNIAARCRDHGSRRQQTNAGYRQQSGTGSRLLDPHR